MFEIKGKVNTAICYAKVVEDEAIEQVRRMCDYSMTEGSKIRIMPDTHAGAGCVIGTTMEIKNKIVPNLVGVDIGCGMLCVKLGKIDLNLPSIDDYIHNNIPSDEILQKVYDICTADDIKPLTDYVTVEAPRTESYGIELKYYTTQQNESAVVQAVEGTGGAIEQYISWQSEQFARDINPDYLKMLCLNAGADRVDIISPVYTEIGRTTVSKFNGTKSVSHETR